eukprot:CAMPEP_0198723990 /NCGR_PEP_ID=MMETSP1475-20131203/1494_1 /TAXON_ID= ORGANISM="Unidentified sp., Strain CCMP1999" /NCGR_SAMPLE_ID=MMETSP1475 /ASSEMBLY_ACC=CAM_ASM_001111 /LENGTH=123 /DNA_ID=CAMNT_0044485347 /DNA_START=177 /DNA_END=548 /DNA_ORIENTATION=+
MAFVAGTVFIRSARGGSCSKTTAGQQFLGMRRSLSVRIASARRTGTITTMSGPSPPPINLPSGALLGIASIMAIATIGCIFELSSGHPQLGTALTSGILAVCAPGFVFLYYAAIKKGQAESEE